MANREVSCYPLRILNERDLPADYAGRAFVWDIDKTYLSTRFSSLRGLARIPLEFAVDKSSIPGMADVLRGLRRGPGSAFAATPLYFVSASPPQLQPVIARKMLLDGVQPDGFVFKDWARTLKELRPGRLRDHLGFKLCALLTGRLARPLAQESLFGDDVERDAEAYSMYGDILDGAVEPAAVERALTAAGVHRDDQHCVRSLWERLPPDRGIVERIYIHLERRSDPAAFARYGERLVAVRDACQLVLALHEAGLVDRGAVAEAAAAVRGSARIGAEELRRRVDDAVRRGLVRAETVRDLDLR